MLIELAPLSALMLADAAHEIGLPAGVFNVVCGSGRVVGEAIVAHPGVDMVSFTGSLAAGRRVASLAGDGIKKVTLELGGKSPFVVLDDAPFDRAIPAGVNNCMQNSGQTCSAWTRMLVPRSRQAEAIELAKSQVAKLTLGDPFDPNVHEAVAYEEHPTQPEGHVAAVVRSGYQLGDRVVRPAQVAVARAAVREKDGDGPGRHEARRMHPNGGVDPADLRRPRNIRPA